MNSDFKSVSFIGGLFVTAASIMCPNTQASDNLFHGVAVRIQ